MGKVAKANRRTGLTGNSKGLATKQGFAAPCQIFGKFGRGGGDGVKSQGGSPNVWGVFFLSRPRAYLKGGYLALLPTYGNHLSHNTHYVMHY
jgi:hypothetical protein